MVNANDFLASRGAIVGTLETDGMLSTDGQIGTDYKPYLVANTTNTLFFLNTPDAGVPTTSRYFLLSVWLNVTVDGDGVFFPFENNATPGILIAGPFQVEFFDAEFNRSILWNVFDAVSDNDPGLNHLLISCDTVAGIYEVFLNGVAEVPFGPPADVVTPFTMDNSGGLYLMERSAPGDTFTELWFDMPDNYVSAATVVNLFYNNGNPVDPGVHGEIPLDKVPVGYFTVRDPLPQGQLELVTLLPMNQPDDVFGVVNDLGADFPSGFSQFSLSGWFCNEVHLQGPYGLATPFFTMDFSPTTATFLFEDSFRDVLFSGTLTNNNPPQNPYNICFSVQTNNDGGIIWPIGGAASALQTLSQSVVAAPNACNVDGSILVGLCDGASVGHAVKWNGTEISKLADFPDRSQAYQCSQDGSVIIGTAFTPNFSDDDMIHWTSGGSIGHFFTPYPGYTNVGISDALFSFRGMSDDGSVIPGLSFNPGGGVPTVWTNGVPSALPNVVLDGLVSLGAIAAGCSSDGTSLIFGNGLGGGGIYTNLLVGIYWIGGTEYSLANTNHSFSLLSTNIDCCNAAGTILYGAIAINLAPGDVFVPVYWDDLAGAQTIHYIDIPAPYSTWTIYYCSDTGNVSVGNAFPAGGFFAAVKATGTSAVLLPDFGFGASAVACSGDGTIVVGTALDANNFFVPVYWDAANAIHILPYPIDATSSYSSGQVVGISRDGTMAFGTASVQKYTFRGNGQEWMPSGISFPTVDNTNNGSI